MNIYYFSGTGNSLIVARHIAKEFKAVLISIPEIMKLDRIHIDVDCIGIVFPSYLAPLSGVPLIVEKFVKKIANIKSLNIFAVCTCGGYECVNALPSLNKLNKIIKSCGGKLSAEYSTRLPMNNLDYDHIPVPINKNQDLIIKKSKKKLNSICKRIRNNNKTKYKIAKTIFNIMMIPLYKLMLPPIINDLKTKAKEPINSTLHYYDFIPLTDKSIVVKKTCNGCGICAKVCPVDNIEIVNDKPEFHHNCEMCFACDEWCLSNAIQHWSRPDGVKYHHPEVKVSDMFK